MTERLADIDLRIDGVRQLGAVVNAMRGIAAARALQARNQMAAVDSYAETIARALSQAWTPAGTPPPGQARPEDRPAFLVFAAEQGFAGAFSERLLDAIGTELSGAVVFMLGTRGIGVATARGVEVAWSAALPSHPSGIPMLADRVAEALYAHIAPGGIGTLHVICNRWQLGHGPVVDRRRLFPFDAATLPASKALSRPLVNLDPATLLADLTAEYMHAQICQAALQAFAAENEARMEAMTAAQTQVGSQLETLQATQRRVRQDEITAEIIELAGGASVNG